MGTSERRERERLRRRDEILKTARSLFFDQGFRDTTIDDIARSAELARGTIYLYFENKEDIYATILEEGLEILLQLIVEAHNEDEDPLTNILAGHDAFMKFHDEYPKYYNVLILDKLQISDAIPAELKARLDAKTNSIADLIAAAIEKGIGMGIFRPMQVREAAYLQMGMAIGFTQIMDLCGPVTDVFADRGQNRQAMHALVANGLIRRKEA